MSEPNVTHNSARQRYEIHQGDELIGFAEYQPRGEALVFTHTEIDSQHEGEGMGTLLARGALDGVRADGKNIVPACAFIAATVDKFPEYRDLVASER